MARLSEESRLALGRAMKPTLSCTLDPTARVLTVKNTSAWTARDVEVLVDINGSPNLQATIPHDMTALGNTKHARVPDLPPITKDLENVGVRVPVSGLDLVSLSSLVTVWFSDVDRIIRYECKYRSDFHIDLRTRKVDAFADAQLVSQIEVDPVTLAPMEGASS